MPDAKFEVLPLAAAPQAELQKRPGDRGLDYFLMAEVTELKVSKGGVGGAVRAASRIGSSSAPQKEPTEASVPVKLLQADGKQGGPGLFQTQAIATRSSSSAGSAGGPSFDEALNEAFDNASKAVVKSLEKK